MTNRMLAFKVNVVPYCCNHNISTRATSTLKANVQYASHFHSFTTIRLHVFADMSEFFMLTTGNCGNLLATKAYLFLYAARFMLMNECLLSHWNWWWRGGCRLVTKSTSLMLYDALAIILFQNLMLQAEGGADWETKNTCMTATIHNLNVMVQKTQNYCLNSNVSTTQMSIWDVFQCTFIQPCKQNYCPLLDI